MRGVNPAGCWITLCTLESPGAEVFGCTFFYLYAANVFWWNAIGQFSRNPSMT